MGSIDNACKKLEEGDLIIFQYDENNTEGPKTVIARYLSNDSKEKILNVGEILVPLERDQYSDPTIFNTHFAKYGEIRNLGKLVLESLVFN